MALNELRKIEITDEMISNLKKYVIEPSDNIYDIRLNEKYKKVLIYPTDDVLLFEHQYEAIKTLMCDWEEMYVMQLGDKVDIFDKKNTVVSMKHPFEFFEYSRIDYYSLTLYFSSSFEWLLITDETFDGGIGILIGTNEKISLFRNNYSYCYSDLLKYVETCLDDNDKTTSASVLSVIINKLIN